jgi:hypothetical protein
MKGRHLAILLTGSALLGACATAEDGSMAPAGVGAIAGSVAADRNGDGIADGYYGSDGIYNAFQTPPCPVPPPPPPPRRGERG